LGLDHLFVVAQESVAENRWFDRGHENAGRILLFSADRPASQSVEH